MIWFYLLALFIDIPIYSSLLNIIQSKHIPVYTLYENEIDDTPALLVFIIIHVIHLLLKKEEAVHVYFDKNSSTS